MPSFEYSAWDGSQKFVPTSADAIFDRLSEHLLEHGDHVMRQLERLPEDEANLLDLLVKEGYVEKDAEGKYAVSPKGIRRIESKALDELFQTARRGAAGKHPSDFKGAGQVRHDDSKAYEFGDPVANLNLHETLRNAVVREGREGRARAGSRIAVDEEDFVVYEQEHQTSCATVLLLDMSGSMARYGKFYQAKKVALALQALVRSRYVEDSLKIVGFYTYASPLSERELMASAPKPVSIFDSRVFLRVPLDDPPDFVPEHFTNIQAGLRFARNHLRRQSAANKQIVCVTDGEPTAHLERRHLVLQYPPSEKTAKQTLLEVEACVQAGIGISTFALIEDYFYLGLQNFVDQMARTAKGTAIYCGAGDLGSYVLESFVKGRRRRARMG